MLAAKIYGNLIGLFHRTDKICTHTFDRTNVLYDDLRLGKVLAIVIDERHPLLRCLQFSTRSGRPLSCACNRDRYRLSFVPSAIRILQKNTSRVSLE